MVLCAKHDTLFFKKKVQHVFLSRQGGRVYWGTGDGEGRRIKCDVCKVLISRKSAKLCGIEFVRVLEVGRYGGFVCWYFHLGNKSLCG